MFYSGMALPLNSLSVTKGPGRWLLVVERVVDRPRPLMSASCAFRAFRRAISAASALRAERLRNGKEKVYGSIP